MTHEYLTKKVDVNSQTVLQAHFYRFKQKMRRRNLNVYKETELLERQSKTSLITQVKLELFTDLCTIDRVAFKQKLCNVKL